MKLAMMIREQGGNATAWNWAAVTSDNVQSYGPADYVRQLARANESDHPMQAGRLEF